MDVCVRLFCVCAVLRVQVAALRLADPPSKESYRQCKKSCRVKDQETEKVEKAQQRAVQQKTDRQTDWL
jgi:hypothetical protein